MGYWFDGVKVDSMDLAYTGISRRQRWRLAVVAYRILLDNRAVDHGYQCPVSPVLCDVSFFMVIFIVYMRVRTLSPTPILGFVPLLSTAK